MRWALADAGDALDDANFETSTANAAILRLTKELGWIEEALAPDAGEGGAAARACGLQGGLYDAGSSRVAEGQGTGQWASQQKGFYGCPVAGPGAWPRARWLPCGACAEPGLPNPRRAPRRAAPPSCRAQACARARQTPCRTRCLPMRSPSPSTGGVGGREGWRMPLLEPRPGSWDSGLCCAEAHGGIAAGEKGDGRDIQAQVALGEGACCFCAVADAPLAWERFKTKAEVCRRSWPRSH
jgi:hypothetical protein